MERFTHNLLSSNWSIFDSAGPQRSASIYIMTELEPFSFIILEKHEQNVGTSQLPQGL